MNGLYHVSSSPHVRNKLTTGKAMYQVILSLMPAAVFGIFRYGTGAFLVIAASVLSAVLTEYLFDRIAGRPNTVKDGSAVVTGLLLALCLPAYEPLYVPCLGSIFAILFVKCFFGGIGHNFMNPALAGRCFLLISFSGVVADFSLDGMSSATPLEALASGQTVNVAETFLGFGNGVIGSSILALCIGGIYLLAVRAITYEIPLAVLVSFSVFLALFGGHGLDFEFIVLHLVSGGIVMGALFMATDPVTSPVTPKGQLIFGSLIGILSGIFRVYGSAPDSASYAIIIANMAVPLIDEISVPVPYGLRKPSKGKKGIPKSAVILCVITLIAGAALSSVYVMTEDQIAVQKAEAKAASYREVCPEAADFTSDEKINSAIEALDGGVYGTDFGKAYINEAAVGVDAGGSPVGYVISVTTGDGFEGNITMSVCILADGTVNGIAFTEINETAGMGMLCKEEAFKGQFAGVNVEWFTLNKAGGSTADNEIDTVSGASTSSGAVVNAVNAALDFFGTHIK
ncbi:MAG: FMN-binding protein [Lachnospiraceae bacterium]|nr:FMN-binding protein [Lachnospiraceae bacterium]MCI9383695.1 FMN-binding protein [Lachnospiraceae bacterium]MCI9624215.1 FMN-binding protein [Lachnospiraceae bacterium]